MSSMAVNCTRSVFTRCVLLLLGYVGLGLLLVSTIVYATTDPKSDSCDEGWLWSTIPAYTLGLLFPIATTVLLYATRRDSYQTQCYSVIFISGISFAFLVTSGISFYFITSRLLLCLSDNENIDLWYFVPVLIGNSLMTLMFKALEMSFKTHYLHINYLATQSLYTRNKLMTALCIVTVAIGYGALVIYCAGRLFADKYVYQVMEEDFQSSTLLYYSPVVIYPLGSSLVLNHLLSPENKLRVARLGSTSLSLLIMKCTFLVFTSAEEIWGSYSAYPNDTYYQTVNAVSLIGSALITIISGLLKLLWMLAVRRQTEAQYVQVPPEEMEGGI